MPTTAGLAANVRRRTVPVAAALLAAVGLAGCSVGVPDPDAAPSVRGATAVATPTITPGHDAAAVAATDLPFSAGAILAQGVPVGLSDGLKEAPGWKPVKVDVAGENQFVKADGCLVSARVSTGQSALVRGDDHESTLALFEYLDPTILPGYLKTAALRWGWEPSGPARNVEVLVLERPVTADGRAVAVLARLFSAAGSSVYISVSCPDTASLSAARADVRQFLPVLPPSD